MPKQLYLLDTVSATKNIDSSYTSSHSFNVTFPFKTTPENVKSISLKSVEIPLFLSSIRNGNGSNTFTFTFSFNGALTYTNVTRTFTIISGNYTVANLITAINNGISSSISDVAGMSFSISAQTGAVSRLTITRLSVSALSLTLADTVLITQILGFSTNRTTTTQTLDSQAPINLSCIDPSIFMYISNLPVVNNNLISLSSFPPYTFKIPLNNIVNNMVYFNDMNELQTIYFNNNSSFVLDKLDIKIYDRYGYLLYGYYNYNTLTLLIEYDDGIKQQEFLNLEY